MPTWLKRSTGLRLAVLLALASPTVGLAAHAIDRTRIAENQAAAPVKTSGSDSEDLAFLAENKPVMDRMMVDMNITSSGDVDRDFVGMMIPHHQGAIDMAVLELRHGRNEQLRRIAQEIIVGQQQEIVAMRLALGQPLPPSAPAPTASAPMQMPMTH
jgi:uncharacterized protein (DUF305 family)